MLIVNSYDGIFNFDKILCIEVVYDEKSNGYDWLIHYEIEDDGFSLEYFKSEREAKEMLQEMMDMFAKGIKIFYTNGRIV